MSPQCKTDVTHETSFNKSFTSPNEGSIAILMKVRCVKTTRLLYLTLNLYSFMLNSYLLYKMSLLLSIIYTFCIFLHFVKWDGKIQNLILE